MPTLPTLTTPIVAGLLVLGALVVLGSLRKGFSGVTVGLAD